MSNSSPNKSKSHFGVLGLLYYDLRTRIDDPDAVISWEISLSSEFFFLNLFLFVDSDACLSTVGNIVNNSPVDTSPRSFRHSCLSVSQGYVP